MTDLIELPSVRFLFDAGAGDGHYLTGAVHLVSGRLLEAELGVLKYRENSISDVFGLQLAVALGLPVPRWLGMWASTTGSVETGPIAEVPYRVGVLTEYLPGLRQVDLDTLALISPDVVTSALLLQLFNRFEPVEYYLTESGSPVALDLNPILASIPLDYLVVSDQIERARVLRQAARNFEIEFDLSFSLGRAEDLGLSAAFGTGLRSLCASTPEHHSAWTDVRGHPLAEMLSVYARSLVTLRVNQLRHVFLLQALPLPDWTRHLGDAPNSR